MSTRSGKCIHVSMDSLIGDTDILLQSERKTRSQKLKENKDLSVKIKHNYVSYPAANDTASVTNDVAEPREKTKRTGKSRRNTLKELNTDVAVPMELNNDRRSVRKSRRGKTIIEDPENVGEIDNQNQKKSKQRKNDKRKIKKKKSIKGNSVQPADLKSIKEKKRFNSFSEVQEIEQNMSGTGDMSVESFHSAAGSPVNPKLLNGNVNQIEVAISCEKEADNNNILATTIKPSDSTSATKATENASLKKRRKSSINNSTFDNIETKNVDKEHLRKIFDKSYDLTNVFDITSGLETNKKRKSSRKNSTFDILETKNANTYNLNTTFDKTTEILTDFQIKSNISLRQRKKSSAKNSIIDNIESKVLDEDELNTTFDKIEVVPTIFNTTIDVSARKRRKSSIKNSTSEKSATHKTKAANDNFNVTFDHTAVAETLVNANLTESNNKHNVSGQLAIARDTGTFNDVNNINDVFNKKEQFSIINSTLNKVEYDDNKTNDGNCIFDEDNENLQIDNIPNESDQVFMSVVKSASKENSENKSLDMTFNKDNSIKLNTTFDSEKKLSGSKKCSLTSTTNITVDNSVDNLHISLTSDESKIDNILNHTPVLIESSIDESLISNDDTPETSVLPITPLKREGTFTKEVSDILTSPKHKPSTEKTSVNRKSSPGSTPFPYSKSSQKEKALLNITRSIEKSWKSPVADIGTRQTRVMFCSPVNNPATVSQMKGRVIKSNLKGSNKSFVLEDNVTSEPRGAIAGGAGRRKRSLTVGEAETRAKRKRLGEELQHSVDRLSRPRTLSAAAKLADTGTPSKKSETPSKARPETKVSRTKLPNFAALHQKRFAKMESLDECQERKAKRAKQLLTPTGSVGLLERISPKGTPPKPGPPVKEPAANLNTPSKPKLPTLESLNPGYTRFGFKLNMDVNPFNVTRKPDTSKENKPKDLKRQVSRPALPSLAGATAGVHSRRDVAKHMVMREKSFTERRDVKRKESRTVIKGVRTNRRFELQMKLRNINA